MLSPKHRVIYKISDILYVEAVCVGYVISDGIKTCHLVLPDNPDQIIDVPGDKVIHWDEWEILKYRAARNVY